MKRLTNKIKEERTKIDEYFGTYYFVGKGREYLPKAVNKLGKLEDLEEQLGLPLEVLFNIVGKDIYIVDSIDNTYLPFTINAFYLDNSIYYLSYVDSMGLDISVKSIDFNKTWFLTYEEAEKKLGELNNKM